MTELEEPEVIPATKSSHGFLGTFISENIAVREESGTLIIVGVPIARTGWQSYVVKDLPQQRAVELGIDVSNPGAHIDLYRPPEEVFAPEFLASLNGSPITNGHPPGGEFVNKDNYSQYALGHIQNPRKGPEQLEDGEWPIIADLVIGGEPLVSRVRNKTVREISLGYDFGIDRDGDKIIQCMMDGNHTAVVPDGRAGDFVRIIDAEPEQPDISSESPAPAEVIEAPAYPRIEVFTSTKEKTVSKLNTPRGLLRRLLGKEVIEMARATDADPDKVMDAVEAMHEHEPEEEKAKDDVEVPGNTQENEFKSEDAGRKRMHDAFDKMMSSDKKHAKDSDIEALKSLMDDYFSEEEKEPEHAAEDAPEVDPAELEQVLAGESEDCAACGGPMTDGVCDDAECPGEEQVESGEEAMDKEGESPDPDSDDDQEDVEDRRRAADAKNRARAGDAKDGARAVLKMLRPVVARTGDKAVQNAWNAANERLTRASRTSTGSYGGFASSARARDKAPRNPNPDRARAADSTGKSVDPNAKLQAAYDEARKGGK